MNKISTAFIFLLICNMTNAQLTTKLINSTNQKLIETAIDNGFIIIRQSYVLEDDNTHQRFGRYGNDEFGKSVSLAIKIKDGIIISEKAIQPWKYDNSYVKYSTTHTPIKTTSEYKELSDSTFHEFFFSTDCMTQLTNGIHVIKDSILFHGNGFDGIQQTNNTNGWLVWVTSQKRIEECDSDTHTAYTIYKYDLKYSADSICYEIEKPRIEDTIWGGIYIIPRQTGIGQLSFYIAGILSCNIKGQWQLFPVNINKQLTEDNSSETEELTLIDGSGSISEEKVSENTKAEEKKSSKNKKFKKGIKNKTII